MNQYIELSNIANSIVYEKATSVAKANAAVEKMYSIVREADSKELSELYNLLDHPSAGTWLAHQLVELHALPKNIEVRCFKIVEKLAKSNSVEALGEQMWLKEWSNKRECT
ncbi:hypothetical protein [Aliiglaciecola sp. M165]|uniref:hypothetical protein n=1 Tax=Aliiglaciecola sp. M165 TaxID=2593649 RepID=UPI00117DF8D5|nr:hypothetical protein [Aliiglaciecola sp. M165]TRY28668.1 hypothetical protein FM019_20625 [Aliiglaciecola sp. M165]